MSDDLNDAKVGDRLISKYPRSFGGTRDYRVTRLTPTQVICGSFRFRKSDGRRVGRTTDGYASVRVASEEELAHNKRLGRIRDAVRTIRQARGGSRLLDGISDEQLVALEDIAAYVTAKDKAERDDLS